MDAAVADLDHLEDVDSPRVAGPVQPVDVDHVVEGVLDRLEAVEALDLVVVRAEPDIEVWAGHLQNSNALRSGFGFFDEPEPGLAVGSVPTRFAVPSTVRMSRMSFDRGIPNEPRMSRE